MKTMKDWEKLAFILLVGAVVVQAGIVKIPGLAGLPAGGAVQPVGGIIQPVTTTGAPVSCPTTLQTTAQIRSFNPVYEDSSPQYNAVAWMVFQDGVYRTTIHSSATSTYGSGTISCGKNTQLISLGNSTIARGHIVNLGLVSSDTVTVPDASAATPKAEIPSIKWMDNVFANMSVGIVDQYSGAGTDYGLMNSTAGISYVQALAATTHYDYKAYIRLKSSDTVFQGDEGLSIEPMILGLDFDTTYYDKSKLPVSVDGKPLVKIDCPLTLGSTYEKCYRFPDATLSDTSTHVLDLGIDTTTNPTAAFNMNYALIRGVRYESTQVPGLIKEGYEKDDTGYTDATTFATFVLDAS